jgi:uncharacterized membrane protein YphA (DoxX/SURF4 family)
MSQYILPRPTRRLELPKPTFVDVLLVRLQGWLSAHSITVLRVALGSIFLTFGLLKLFPGYSPAAQIAARTLDRLTLGLVSGETAVLVTAVTEVVIGLTLVTGLFLRIGLVVLAGALLGIMSPLVLFTAELFPHGPSLLGQYVLKDVILAAAGLVIGAWALGSRLRPTPRV